MNHLSKRKITFAKNSYSEAMADNSIFLIDIDKILKEKAGKKANYVPRFVVSYLKRIVHQDEINEFLKGVKDKEGVEFLAACMNFLVSSIW